MKLFGLLLVESISAISFQRLLADSNLPNATIVDLFEDLQVNFNNSTVRDSKIVSDILNLLFQALGETTQNLKKDMDDMNDFWNDFVYETLEPDNGNFTIMPPLL